MTEKTKKISKLDYDENGGIILMQTWAPALRWISILPSMIIVFLFVRFVVLGIILNIIEKNSDELFATYIGALAAGIPFFCMVDIASAVAPSKRYLTSLVISTILVAILTCFYIFVYENISDVEFTIGNTNMKIVLTIAFISVLFGLFFAIKTTSYRHKKAKRGV